MMPGLQTKKEKTRKRIVATAAAVFAEKGYAGTAIADIAARAGIGKGTVYGYFSGKEALFLAVFEWFINEFGKSVTVNIATLGKGAAARLDTLSRIIVTNCVEMKHLYALTIEFWAASKRESIEGRLKALFTEGYAQFGMIVSALIKEGMQSGEFRTDLDPEPLAATLVGTWDILGLQAWFNAEFDALKAERAFMQVFIRGLKAAPDEKKDC
jgi:AcrR family transcriptional regulator